jgi:hypothetical protein
MKYANGNKYEGDWDNDKENGQGTMIYADNGRTYTGEWKDGIRVGKGIITFKSGDSYEGQWENNKMNGQGIYKFAKGDVYKGQFKDNEFHGQGIMNFKNKASYVGEWKDNKMNGRGKFTFDDGDVYEGEFKDGNRNGEGKMTYINRDVYKGEWKDDKMNGRGKFTFDDGNEYEGEWKNNNRNGKGKMEYNNGDVYEGEWIDGNKNGKGKMKYANGNVYEGNWVNGIRDGQGITTYNDGDIYEGNWKNNDIHGKGIMKYADGSSYDGEWKNGDRIKGNLIDKDGYILIGNGDKYRGGMVNGVRNGKGEMIYKDGSSYVGDWGGNKRNGHGRMNYAYGDVYKGEWKDDKIHGRGIMTYADGDVYDGEWKNNNRNGKGKMNYKNGGVYEGIWANNQRNGQGIYKYPNGVVCVGKWKDDNFIEITLKNSIGKEYVDNGYTYDDDENLYKGEMVNGERNGKGEMIYENGDIYNGNWINDERNGHGTMNYAYGDRYDGNWENDLRHGQGKMTYSDGDVCEGEWKDDNPLGKYTFVSGEVLRGEWKEIINDGEKQNIFTELYEPTESLYRKKTMKSLSPKTNATMKNYSFVLRHISDRGVMSYLNSVCPDSGECMMFGRQKERIKKLFNNFYSFDFMKSHKKIGSESSNGFVHELEYERKEHKTTYQSYAVLKSSQDSGSNNLLYEAFVGVYVNKLCVRFPCFVETYGSLVYKNIGSETTSLYVKLFKGESGINKTEFSNSLTLFSDCNKYSNFFNNHNLSVSNECSTSFSVLVQHIKNAKTFHDHFKSGDKPLHELITILYQIYSVLSILSENFTHNDLHNGNVLLYTPTEGRFIRMNYHYPDNSVVSFNTNYISKIIDYGMSYFRDDKTNISTDTFKTKIDSFEKIKDSYNLLPKKHDNKEDLWLLLIVKDFNKLYKFPYSSFDDEILNNIKNEYSEDKDIHYSHQGLKSFVQSHEIQSVMLNTNLFPADKLLGTMDIYLDGSERPMTYKPYSKPASPAAKPSTSSAAKPSTSSATKPASKPSPSVAEQPSRHPDIQLAQRQIPPRG